MLAFQDTPPATFDLPGLRVEPVAAHGGASRMDLLWSLRQHHADHGAEAGVEGLLEYDTELFTPATARLLLTRLEVLLRAAVAEPHRRIADLPVLVPGERERITGRWNSTAREVPSATVAELFADRRYARRTHPPYGTGTPAHLPGTGRAGGAHRGGAGCARGGPRHSGRPGTAA